MLTNRFQLPVTLHHGEQIFMEERNQKMKKENEKTKCHFPLDGKSSEKLSKLYSIKKSPRIMRGDYLF